MSVVDVAKMYLGETEKPGNSGFNSQVFEMRLRACGWEKGQAWCAYFAELCFKEAFPQRAKEFDKLFNASATKTFTMFKNAGFKISDVPVVGSLVIWQKYVDGRPQWQGHAGICSEVLDNVTFHSIEGNTNDMGSREGYIVASHPHTTTPKRNGLNVMGFIII